MDIKVNSITKRDAELAEKYIKANGIKPKYMTREEMSEQTGLPDRKCGAVMNALVRNNVIQKVYGIYCPSCGILVDKSPVYTSIHMSGYRCCACGSRVSYDRKNFVKLYAPQDSLKMKALSEFRLISGKEKKETTAEKENSGN